MAERRIVPVKLSELPRQFLSVVCAQAQQRVWDPSVLEAARAQPAAVVASNWQPNNPWMPGIASETKPKALGEVAEVSHLNRTPWEPTEPRRLGVSKAALGPRTYPLGFARLGGVSTTHSILARASGSGSGGGTIADDAALRPATAFGVSLWVRPYDSLTLYTTIVGKGLSAVGQAGWVVTIDSPNRLRATISTSPDTHTSAPYIYVDAPTLVADRWRHLVVQIDTAEAAAIDRVRFWIDGVELTTNKTVSGSVPATLQTGTAPFHLGLGAGASPTDFVGHLSRLALFPGSVLTQTAVDALYNGGVPPSDSAVGAVSPAPTAYYNCQSSLAPTIGTLGSITLSGDAEQAGIRVG